MENIFNSSQNLSTAEAALTQLKKLYKTSDHRQFKPQFINCFKKLLQSETTIYFKTSCEFICRFLKHVTELAEEAKTKGASENTAPQRKTRRTSKRRRSSSSEDELIAGLNTPKKRRSTTPASPIIITNHDHLISSCIDVADLYMQVADEGCRSNAVFFICKFLSHVEALDEKICDALKSTLPKRIRDRKPMIRAQAVLASRTFQDNKLTKEAFLHHFQRDPDIVVRKALLQIMDTKVFGYDFLIESTQDANTPMRRIAFQRLGKVSPADLTQQQLHCVIHNGLIERERQVSYSFKTHTLEPWLSSLYDGIDLHKLLEPFDLINYHDDVCLLLKLIYDRDLANLQDNGATTKLHHVAESFRNQWLNADGNCLPELNQVDDRISTIWLTLLEFCKSERSNIKPITIRTLLPIQDNDEEESIEKIVNSQMNDDETAELYERLTPDLVNLVDFIKKFVNHFDNVLRDEIAQAGKVEYMYQQLMTFTATYEIGDEVERQAVQEVFGKMLKDNLLTRKINNFIPPIIRCLNKLIYHNSSNLMINYVSELINNVRSHLEDLATSTQPQITALSHSRISAPRAVVTRSAKKVRISEDRTRRSSYASIEFEIATIRVELAELQDSLDKCVKEKDFDGAKTINSKIDELRAKMTSLHDCRCSISSDISHMSMVLEDGPGGPDKLSSTMIGDTPNVENNEGDVKVFKHHTNELIKCLQMYLGCLQQVKISEVPQTMLNHLMHLTLESLDDWFINEPQVRSLMILCHGVTALTDEKYARDTRTTTLLIAACNDPMSIESRTAGFKSVVDIICQHEDLSISMTEIEKFLNVHLRDYGKHNPKNIKKNEYEFLNTLIEGTLKLYHFRKLLCPRIFSHLVLWWYHPQTHPRLKQMIGIFLPMFVNRSTGEIGGFFEDLFVRCLKHLHDYILGPGFKIMTAYDMQNLINFLCNLIPLSFHPRLHERVDLEIESTDTSTDFLKYLKQSKSILASTLPSNKEQS